MSVFDPETEALFAELDELSAAASAALAVDDWEAWSVAAGRGAEIHEELAKRWGWREGR